MALDQAGVNALYNELLGRDATFGSESDFDADWWLGQSDADVRRGITSGSEFLNRQQLVDNAGEGGISEADLDRMVMAGGTKTTQHSDFENFDGDIFDFNAGNTWQQGIMNSDSFDPFTNNTQTNQNIINNRLGVTAGTDNPNYSTVATGNPIVGTANDATATLPTITDTTVDEDGSTVTEDPYGGGVIALGGPNKDDDISTLQQQIADLTAANNNNANNNANNNNNANQQAAADGGWWNQFADADAFKSFLNDTGDTQQTQQSSQFDQFLQFMQALQGMGGFGGGSGYGYGGYGGFSPGGVRPNTGMNNIMNALNAFKFLGSGGGQNVTTGLQNIT